MMSNVTHEEPELPTVLPLEASSDPQGVWDRHFAGGEPTPDTALGTALLWWQALSDPVEFRNALDNLSAFPEAWGDYSEPAGLIAHLSIMTEPMVIQEGPPVDIAGIKFMHFGGEDVGVAFDSAVLDDVWIVTLIKPEESPWWQVWGLSHNYPPTPDEIYRRR